MTTVLWLSDYKTSDHIGGAELSNEALLEAAPSELIVKHIHVHTLDPLHFEQIKPDLLIVDSITRLTRHDLLLKWLDRIPFISIEYDYSKISKTRELIRPGNRYLYARDDWCRFHHTFWTHPNRRNSFFMSVNQMMIHYWMLNRADLNIDRKNWSVLSSVFSTATI